MGGWGGVGGPCDFSVSPSPFGLDFGTLDFGTSDLGLTIVLCEQSQGNVTVVKREFCSKSVFKYHLLN